jgi:exodeoxyribonuclease VII large subunit
MIMADSNESRRTIRQTNALIRALVEQETIGHPFWIGGVVTRCFTSNLGHVYFDLDDENCSISCIVHESVRGTLESPVSNGMEIEVFGSIAVYERAARVQMDVEKIRVIERPRYVIDNATIEQLTAKGLWPKVKQPIPSLIRKIGLVTSKQSDALHDFEDQYRSDNGTAAIKLTDVRLQGQQAPREIAGAIEKLNREQQTDVIVLVRGGGRGAELAVFNDLLIAEAICHSEIPVVTGIGHQRDETLADQLADYAAITPTAAASYLAQANPSQQSVAAAPAKPTARWALYLSVILAIIVIILIVVMLVGRG